MAERTVQKRAGELTGHLRGHIHRLRAQAAEKATLNHAWVLERLMRNVKIALGEETLRVTVKGKGDEPASTIEISMRDAHAANRGLKLLPKPLGMLGPEQHRVTLAADDGQPVNTIDLARRILHLIEERKKQVPPGQTRR
jgi:hypothetical protein